MKYGITHLSQISMREKPTHQSQLVSQLLFGDVYQVEEVFDDWLKIKTLDCGYEGFIEKKVWREMAEDDVTEYQSLEKYVVPIVFLFVNELKTDLFFPVFIGSSFPIPKNNLFVMGGSVYKVIIPEEKEVEKISGLTDTQSLLIEFASVFLYAPYLWGGRTPAGIDCSAFVQLVFKRLNILLPRDTSQQVNYGTQIDFQSEWQAGDLAFFGDDENQITHVGIICNSDTILHASGLVDIDTIDTTGIYSEKLKQYTHKLRVVKRIL